MSFDFDSFTQRFLVGFGYAIGVAAAKWFCTIIPVRGFNLFF